MLDRKIVKTCGDEFMILKPCIEGGWNKIGRRYDERGIGSYVTNESVRTAFDTEDLSEEDRAYIENFIRLSEV